ncbi:MAG: hypothetical protein MUF64_05670 [Polyangiaceae bacterium]|jgi:hypothetical protein|nr:hypothetical protein [Polyangiaceae bacterium]
MSRRTIPSPRITEMLPEDEAPATPRRAARSPRKRPQAEAPAPRAAARAVSPRDRLVSTVDELRTIESELEEMAKKTRSRLGQGAEEGAIAAGGFSSADSLLVRVSRPGSYLASLGTCHQPAAPRPEGQFGQYAALLDELDSHERSAMSLVEKARKRLSFLEEGAFRSGGYRSYEEFLERVLKRMPMLATTLLVTDPRLSRRPPEPAPIQPEILTFARKSQVAPAPVPPSADRAALLPAEPEAPAPAPAPLSAPSPDLPAPRGRRVGAIALGMVAFLGLSLVLGRGQVGRLMHRGGTPQAQAQAAR